MEYGMTHEIRSTHEEERGTHLSYHRLYTHYAPCPPNQHLQKPVTLSTQEHLGLVTTTHLPMSQLHEWKFEVHMDPSYSHQMQDKNDGLEVGIRKWGCETVKC